MIGRIESYVHSDATTENKGAVLVKITTDTDFAARTPAFKEFARAVAMRAYAALPYPRAYLAGQDMWQVVIAMFPDLETQRALLEREMREKITVKEIAILRL